MAILGISFPFGKSSSSFPGVSVDAEVIEDNMIRILQTPRKSRVMRPGLGSDVYDAVYENSGPVLRSFLDFEVRRSISEGEPRAKILSTDVSEEDTIHGRKITLTILWELNSEIRRTSVRFSS